jgi:hypothetical protein
MNNEFERYLAILEGKQEKLELLKLPYSRDALSPVKSRKTIDYHYANLAQAYVDRFNKGEGDAKFNKAGAFLHNLYFPGLKEPSSKNQPTGKSAEIINKKYKSFARNGALLSEDKKARLREIDTELAKLKLTFGENVLAETNNYELHITNEGDLKGLPEGAIEMARSLAESKAKEGWIFTLDFPSYLPFVTYADNRELRKEISIAAGKKAFQNSFIYKIRETRIISGKI